MTTIKDTGYEQRLTMPYRASVLKRGRVPDCAQFGVTAALDDVMVQTKWTLNAAWVIFVAATLLLCAVTRTLGAVDPEMETLIALGAVKGRMTLGLVMEARAFPLTWRIFCEAWLLVAAALTISSRLLAHWCF